MLTLRAIVGLLLAGNAIALSALAPPSTSSTSSSRTGSSTIFSGLQSTPLIQASTSSPTILTKQWRQKTPFGIADETAVVAFLRHFGCFLCWEHAAQLRDVVLPATSSKKVFFVGVGSATAVQEFAEQLGIDPKLCFADPNGAMGDTLELEKGFKTMWNPPAVQSMMGRNDEDSLKALGESFKGAVDKIGFKQLAPEEIQDTLRQGGTFVFKGDRLLLEHYDAKVGDNCMTEDILRVL